MLAAESELHVWDKYTVKDGYVWSVRVKEEISRRPGYGYYGYELDPVTGAITWLGEYQYMHGGNGTYYIPNNYDSSTFEFHHYYYQCDYNPDGSCAPSGYYATESFIMEKYQRQSKTMGDFIQTVFSSNRYSYPNNGLASDGFWYLYKGTNQFPAVMVTSNNHVLLPEIE